MISNSLIIRVICSSPSNTYNPSKDSMEHSVSYNPSKDSMEHSVSAMYTGIAASHYLLLTDAYTTMYYRMLLWSVSLICYHTLL